MSQTWECAFRILVGKIKENQAQYDLDREAAKISALSSKELDKYEYLTGEDLGYKPGVDEYLVAEQAKFEYSLLGKVFNKGLEKENKKEGLLKTLKNIEGKNKEQLKEIEYQREKQVDIINKQGKKTDVINKQKKKLKDVKKTNKIVLKRTKIRRDCVIKRHPKWHTDECW